MQKSNKNIFQSFKFAFKGILTGIKESRNLKIHLTFTFLVIIFGIFFRISALEWVILLILIGLVISAELINTSIEDIENIIRDEAGVSYKFTGKGKDLAAGAVFVLAIIAAIIGLMIFLPKLFFLIYV